jgi:hypothetical protein
MNYAWVWLVIFCHWQVLDILGTMDMNLSLGLL